MTTWREVEGWPYEVSDAGEVRRSRSGRFKTGVGRVLKPGLASSGYLSVNLYDGPRRRKGALVHHLVAHAFIGPRPVGAQINHIDGIKSNNSAVNLEYVSRAENVAHASRLGLRPRGTRSPSAKLNEADVLEIRACLARGESQKSIGARFGVYHTTIADIADGTTWGWFSQPSDSLNSEEKR